MTAIGEMLRRERLRRNLDLEQISSELKISSRYLDAIESEQFDKLPGAVFAKSFVRQYARLLGLDEEDIAAEVKRQVEPAPETPGEARRPGIVAHPEIQPARMKSWQSVGDGSRFHWSAVIPALALVVMVVLVCAGVYAWWQRERHPRAPASQAQTAQSQSPAPSGQASAEAVTAAEPPASQPATQAGAPETASGPEPGATASTPGAAATSADRRVIEAASPQTENAIRPASLQPASASGAAVHVELAAAEPVWVRVRENGKYVFSGTIEANQSRALDATGVVELLVGNAGGLNISLNGKPIGPVGPKGQVRTVQLSSGGFKIVSSNPEVPFDPL